MNDRSLPTPFFYAQRVLLQMQNAGSLAKGPPIAIDDIAKAVISISGVSEIRFRSVDSDSHAVMGLFQRFKNTEAAGSQDIAEIVIGSRLNNCWRRFVACKEICQVFLSDFPEARSAAPAEIAAYVAGLLEPASLTPFSPALEADRFATFCAIEIMCPFFLREELYLQIKQGKRTTFEVAKIFMVPEYISAIVFNSSYHENARQTLIAERSADFRFNPRSRSLSSDLQIMFQRNVEEALRENGQLREGLSTK